jgi:hypothetical protein
MERRSSSKHRATIKLQGLIAAYPLEPSISEKETDTNATMNNKLNNDWKHPWE